MILASKFDFACSAKEKELEVADFALAVMANKRLTARNVIPKPMKTSVSKIVIESEVSLRHPTHVKISLTTFLIMI
jgi:hypothetical protein